ncbi:MAG: phenylacetate--CoA ligase family protein [Gemmatimonadales bacterium]
MRDEVLSLYHGLPASARSAAATLRGLYLHLWRYGPESGRLRAQTLERDGWTAEQWRTWREERLAYVLHRAATRVPYYREQWARRRAAGDRSSWEILDHWPVLEKDAVREHPRAFLADDCHPRRMFHEQTSGTTGKPLDLWRTRLTVSTLYALSDARTDAWHGVPPRARYARLGGQLVTPVRQRRPPFWVWNVVMRQLYMSTYHLAPDLIGYYLDALQRYRVVYLAGYTSSLVALAQEAIRLGRGDLGMMIAFTNAEPLHPDQRTVISEAFRCPVRETYGQTETVAYGSECPAGRLHLWPEVGHLEVWVHDGPAPAGTAGEFIGTGLLNADMPLIRYRVGDRGRLAPPDDHCTCGRRLPLISAVEGRTNDVLVTRDGRQVWWLNPVFYGQPIRQSQIAQDSLQRLTVRVAPADGFGPGNARAIVERLRSRMGDIEVDLQLVDEVPRSPNGKLKAIVCNLSAQEREAALRGGGGATAGATS